MITACIHGPALGEPCTACADRLLGDDDPNTRLDAQRDTLLAQSARLDQLFDLARVLEARIADQDALILALQGKAGTVARHARGLEKRIADLEQRQQAPDQSM